MRALVADSGRRDAVPNHCTLLSSAIITSRTYLGCFAMLLDAPKFRRAAVAARQELKWSHNDTDQVDGSPALSSSEAAHATDAGDTFFNEPLWRHPALLLDMSPVVGPLKQGGGSSDDTATAASKQPLADLLSVVSADIGNISQNPSSGAAKDRDVVNLIRDAFADTAKWEAQLGDVRSKASGSGEGGSETAVGIRSLALQLFEQLSSLTVPGQLLIFPAGSLTHTYPDPEPALILLVFTVEHLEDKQPVFSVMVCSAGPLGFAHHPSKAAEPPLVKLQPCVLLPRVCAGRLLDRAFCSMLVHNTVVNNCSPLPVRTLTLPVRRWSRTLPRLRRSLDIDVPRPWRLLLRGARAAPRGHALPRRRRCCTRRGQRVHV